MQGDKGILSEKKEATLVKRIPQNNSQGQELEVYHIDIHQPKKAYFFQGHKAQKKETIAHNDDTVGKKRHNLVDIGRRILVKVQHTVASYVIHHYGVE